MEESWIVGRVCCRDVSAERNRRIPRNFGWDVYMPRVLCMRAEKEWEWGDVEVGGQVTDFFSFSGASTACAHTRGSVRSFVLTLFMLSFFIFPFKSPQNSRVNLLFL